MKTKKKYFIIGGIALFAILLTGFGLVAAWGPCGGFGRDFHSGFHDRGFHPGFHSKDFSEFILWRLDKRVEELDLSEAQKGKYEEIKGKIETQLKDGMDDRKRLMEELQTEINKENPDLKVLAESIKKRIKRISAFMKGNLDLFVEFYENLDEEQKDRIMATIRKKMERCRI